MPYYDLPGHELVAYAPDLSWPADAELFWSSTIAESRALARPPVWQKIETGLTLVDTYDVTFSGFGGDPVRAWLHLPAGSEVPVPAVACFPGYGGGRGEALEVGLWPLAGYACLTMDIRGQGSAWRSGDTPDPAGAAPSHPGFMTRGILDPQQYYCRRVYTDAVLALDALRAHPLVRQDRVAVCGASQGGGITLAAAAMAAGVWAALIDVPFLCDFRRATQMVATDPYGEIVRYLKVHRDQTEAVFATLAYFDAATLAQRATAPRCSQWR